MQDDRPFDLLTLKNTTKAKYKSDNGSYLVLNIEDTGNIWFYPGDDDDPFEDNGWTLSKILRKSKKDLIRIYSEDQKIHSNINWKILNAALQEPEIMDTITFELEEIKNKIQKRYHESRKN